MRCSSPIAPFASTIRLPDRSAKIHRIPVISVVVPVYRSAETLHELHRRLRDVLDAGSRAYEIVFVDDACPEGSRAVLEAIVQNDARVSVLTLGRHVGQQQAVLAGLGRARGRCVVVMDADLQDPPEAIPELLAAVEQDFAAVFAGRRGKHEPFVRRLTSRLFKSALHALCSTPTDAGLYVAMRRDMVERVLAFGEPGPSVVAMSGCVGLPMSSVPVQRAPRSTGRSGYSVWTRMNMGALTIVWVVAQQRRARQRQAPARHV